MSVLHTEVEKTNDEGRVALMIELSENKKIGFMI